MGGGERCTEINLEYGGRADRGANANTCTHSNLVTSLVYKSTNILISRAHYQFQPVTCTLAQSHTHTQSRTLSHLHTHSHTLTRSHTHSVTCTLTVTHTHTVMHAPSMSLYTQCLSTYCHANPSKCQHRFTGRCFCVPLFNQATVPTNSPIVFCCLRAANHITSEVI